MCNYSKIHIPSGVRFTHHSALILVVKYATTFRVFAAASALSTWINDEGKT